MATKIASMSGAGISFTFEISGHTDAITCLSASPFSSASGFFNASSSFAVIG